MVDQKTLDPHRIVIARRRLVGRVEVVDDVDATDECDRPVDARNLAMHAPQPVAAQRPGTDVAPEYEQLHAGLPQHGPEARREVARAVTIEQQVHPDPTHRSARKRAGDQAAGLIVGKDVGLEEHLL